MSCRLAPDAPSVACIAGTATFTMLVSSTAMAWPTSTMVSASHGGVTRPVRPLKPGRCATAGRAPSARSVMPLSLTLFLCWYQEPGYPGTSTTWHGAEQHGSMASVSVTTVDGGSRANHGQAASTARRTELAAFLRSRRERISPEDVGLPVGTRRRTAGLRREEIAQLAGVGVTWYTWLEQGRPINASVQVLDAIARTLRLDGTERGHLFRLADVPGAAAQADCVECTLPPEVQRILDAIPYPASVVTERFDLIAWNRVYAALFPRLTEAPANERNTLLSCLIGPACCSPVPEQDKYSATLIAQLRAAYGKHVGDPAWTHFIRRLA